MLLSKSTIGVMKKWPTSEPIPAQVPRWVPWKNFRRCGEESTFTVSAMRTAGIPARTSIYAAMAHSDDNHAW